MPSHVQTMCLLDPRECLLDPREKRRAGWSMNGSNQLAALASPSTPPRLRCETPDSLKSSASTSSRYSHPHFLCLFLGYGAHMGGHSPSRRHCLSEMGRIRFRRVWFQTPNSVNLFGPRRVPGRELSEFLSAYYLCAKTNSPSSAQNLPILAQNSVSSLVRNSTLETVLRPFPSLAGRHALSSLSWPRCTTRCCYATTFSWPGASEFPVWGCATFSPVCSCTRC